MMGLIAVCLVLITIAMLFGSDAAAGLVKGIFKLAIVGIVIIIFLVIIYL